MSITEQKQTARQAAFKRRLKAFAEVRADISVDVLALADGHEHVAAYMPMRTEFDILPTMNALHEAGKVICVPRIIAKDAPLTFHKWTPDTPMIEGEFGALIPAEVNEVIPTLVLAPLVAFDAHGTRLGYGGGFYDRTIAGLRANDDCAYWGIAFSAQESAEPLPSEPTDIPLDGIITERGATPFSPR